MLDAALDHANAGWPVFPCHPKTKRPLLGNDVDDAGKTIANTGGLKKASTDGALLRFWWGKWPRAMIGVPTGLTRAKAIELESANGVDDRRSDGELNNGCGAFVVDLDIPKDTKDADGACDDLLKLLPPGRAAVSRTASGGMHLWFAMPEGEDAEILGNRAGLLPKPKAGDPVRGNVDVRGNGGYVIVPPSVRDDGAFYEWEDGERPDFFTPTTDDMLDLVIKTRGEPERPEPKPHMPRVANSNDDNVEKYALAALDKEIGDLARCGEGGRNDALNRAAFSLGTLVGAGVLSQAEVEGALRDAARANGLVKDDGLPSVEKTIASGLRGGMGSPRDLRGISVSRSEQSASTSLGGRPCQGQSQSGPVQRWHEENEAFAARQNERDAENSISGRAKAAAGFSRHDEPPPQPPLGEPYTSIPEAIYDNESGLLEHGDNSDDGGVSFTLPDDTADDEAGAQEASSAGGARGKKKDHYSTVAMNKDWALVLMGAKATVVHEQPNGPVEDRLRVLTVEAFNAWFANRYVERIQPDGKSKAVTWSKAWMTSAARRQYKGLVFQPDPDGDVSEPDYLNLWRGFDLTPDSDGTEYVVFKDHLLTNVCCGDTVLRDWVFAWFAHMFQRPRDRPGTALVFRGKMGAGKSIVGEVMGSLIAAHYYQIDDPRYVTGNFNAHMASCLLLQAEEAVWAGDKAAEGRLKGLITSKHQMIEAKGIDPIRVDNYVRLMMTSNEDWVVPAGKDERRFCVLDVGDGAAQNHGYFSEMFEELNNGGRERLLYDLLTFDLDGVNLWQIPRTAGLLEQKIRSLDSVESWWFERLMNGEITRKASDSDAPWPAEIPKRAVFEDYIDQADTIGIKRKSEEVVFGTKLRKIAPAMGTCRPFITDMQSQTRRRVWCYRLPPLADCRGAFEDAVGQGIVWPEGE